MVQPRKKRHLYPGGFNPEDPYNPDAWPAVASDYQGQRAGDIANVTPVTGMPPGGEQVVQAGVATQPQPQPAPAPAVNPDGSTAGALSGVEAAQDAERQIAEQVAKDAATQDKLQMASAGIAAGKQLAQALKPVKGPIGGVVARGSGEIRPLAPSAADLWMEEYRRGKRG